MNIRHILVPVDFSAETTHSIDYAIAIGKKFSSRITLFHVVQPMPPPDQFMPAQDCQRAMADAASERLRDLSATDTLSIDVETDLTSGNPFSSIVDRAQQGGIDLIIMPTHGRTGLKHVLMGSVAERVVQYAPCPVLVVRPRQSSAAD